MHGQEAAARFVISKECRPRFAGSAKRHVSEVLTPMGPSSLTEGLLAACGRWRPWLHELRINRQRQLRVSDEAICRACQSSIRNPTFTTT